MREAGELTTDGAREGPAALDGGAGFGLHNPAQRPSSTTRVRRLAGPFQPRLFTPTRSPARGQTPPRGRARPDRYPGRSRARLSRRLPVLALLHGALSLFAAALAEAQNNPVWSATYTPPTGLNCHSVSACSSALTDNEFVVGGQTYGFSQIIGGGGNPIVTLTAGKNSALQALKFCVGSNVFDFPDNTDPASSWSNTGLTWTPGTPVSLSIGTSCAQQMQSPDATLSALTASGGTSAAGTFTALSIGTFASDTTSDTASVANSVTHVKLTPTVNDSGATVKVGKGSSLTAVASGSASGAIPSSSTNPGDSSAIFVPVLLTASGRNNSLRRTGLPMSCRT